MSTVVRSGLGVEERSLNMILIPSNPSNQAGWLANLAGVNSLHPLLEREGIVGDRNWGEGGVGWQCESEFFNGEIGIERKESKVIMQLVRLNLVTGRSNGCRLPEGDKKVRGGVDVAVAGRCSAPVASFPTAEIRGSTDGHHDRRTQKDRALEAFVVFDVSVRP